MMISFPTSFFTSLLVGLKSALLGLLQSFPEQSWGDGSLGVSVKDAASLGHRVCFSQRKLVVTHGVTLQPTSVLISILQVKVQVPRALHLLAVRLPALPFLPRRKNKQIANLRAPLAIGSAHGWVLNESSQTAAYVK